MAPVTSAFTLVFHNHPVRACAPARSSGPSPRLHDMSSRAGRAGGRAPDVPGPKDHWHCLSVRLFRACVLPAILL